MKKPLPIHFGDTVYRLTDKNTIVTEEVTQIGINEDGSVFLTDDDEFTIGKKSLTFLTREDAERYLADPEHFPDDYARVDSKKTDLPYRPGTVFYYVEEPFFMDPEWYVFEGYYTYVILKRNGVVLIGDGFRECEDGIYMFFRTIAQARKYISENGGEEYTFVPM